MNFFSSISLLFGCSFDLFQLIETVLLKSTNFESIGNSLHRVHRFQRGCPGVPVHEGIPIVFITIHGVMTQFVNVSFFCVPVHEDTTISTQWVSFNRHPFTN